MTGAFNGEITEVEPDYNVVKEVDDEGYENGYLTRYVIAKIGETEYYNLQTAIDAVSENNSIAVTIQIVRNNAVILSETTITNKKIILDLNGNALDLFKPITNTEGSLEIIDSSEEKTGIITNLATGTTSDNLLSTIVNSGTLKVSAPVNAKNSYSIGIRNNGTLEVASTGIITANGRYSYGIYNGGTVTSAGTITVTSNGNYSYGIYNAETGTVTNAGAITVTASYAYSYGIYNEGAGTITNAGTIKTSENGIYNAGTGTIINTGTITNNGSCGIYNKTSGKVKNEGEINVTYRTSSNAYGISNISNGEVENTGNITVKNTYTQANARGIDNSSSGNINITEGNITSSGIGIYNQKDGRVNITGGNITGTSNYGIYNNSTGNVDVTGGTIAGTNYGIYNSSNGSINITGGSVTATSTSTNSAGVYNNKGTVTIGEKGGEVNTTVPEIKGKTYGVDSTTAGTINFYDGVVKGIKGAFNGTVTELEPNYQILETTVDEYKCAKLLPIGEGIPSASIGSVNYFSLQDAIKSSQDGNVIVVRKNINLETSNLTVDVDKNITINLNGYTISSQTDEATIKNEGTLIIKDTSANNTGKIENTTGAAIESKGTLIIGEDDGTINRDAPTIVGGSKGIVNNQGVLKIFDGNIIGIVAIEGDVTATPEGHEIVEIPILTKKKATLN